MPSAYKPKKHRIVDLIHAEELLKEVDAYYPEKSRPAFSTLRAVIAATKKGKHASKALNPFDDRQEGARIRRDVKRELMELGKYVRHIDAEEARKEYDAARDAREKQKAARRSEQTPVTLKTLNERLTRIEELLTKKGKK